MDDKKVILVNGEEYTVHIHYERRFSSRASITGKGIYIRIPRLIPPLMREQEVEKLLLWVKHKIATKPQVVQQAKVYTHGMFLKTTTKIYQLFIEMSDRKKNFTKHAGSTFTFRMSHDYGEVSRQRYISKQLQRILAKKHLPELVARVHYLNNLHFRKPLGKISFKYTTSRWGACRKSTAEINISTRLLLAPQEVMDYVIIHELAHLVEEGHNEYFWGLVKGADPQYKEKVRWLKSHGNTLNI